MFRDTLPLPISLVSPGALLLLRAPPRYVFNGAGLVWRTGFLPRGGGVIAALILLFLHTTAPVETTA